MPGATSGNGTAREIPAIVGLLPGFTLLAIAAVSNRWMITSVFAPRGYAVPVVADVAICAAQLAIGGLGLFLLWQRRRCEAWCGALLAGWPGRVGNLVGRHCVPTFDRRVAYCVAPVLILNLAFAWIIEQREHFPVFHPLPWVYLFNKVLFDAALYLALVGMTLRAARMWPLAMCVAYFYLAMVVADMVIYYFGYTLFQKQYLFFVTPYSLWGFLEGRVALLAAAAIGLAILVLPIYRLRHRFTNTEIRRCIIFVGLLGVLNGPAVFYRVSSLGIVWDLQREVYKRLNQQLGYVAQNSLVNLVGEFVWSRPTESNHLSMVDNRRVIDHFNLPLGHRDYPSLGLKPFSRVVLITTESLSLDLLGSYNPQVPPDVSPFYASENTRALMFRNYRTSAVPTLPGLAVLFASHPNAALAIEKRFPQSLVRVLREAGYQTVFLRSVSKFFGNENVHFRNAGFDQMIGAEEFESRKEYRPYVRDWGACDRIVYRELIRLLEENRGRRTFVTLLGVDTHPPAGRRDYGPLEYPEVPDYISRQEGADRRGFLRSVFYHDYDIHGLIDALASQGLWDDETLVILTADHSVPLNGVVSGIAGYPQQQLSRIPLVFLTPQKLPQCDRDRIASQLDLAPTLLHLLNLPIPVGFWGESVFFSEKHNPFIGVFRNTMHVEGEGIDARISLNAPQGEMEKGLVELYRGFVE